MAGISIALQMAAAIVAGPVSQKQDGASGYLVIPITGSQTTAINIPLPAIQDRRAVYGIAACQSHVGPGAYCTGDPFCATCQQCIQKCIDEHNAAGRLPLAAAGPLV